MNRRGSEVNSEMNSPWPPEYSVGGAGLVHSTTSNLTLIILELPVAKSRQVPAERRPVRCLDRLDLVAKEIASLAEVEWINDSC